MLGTASLALPKNSMHTVRVCAGMRCSTQRALVIRPSQPSFWMPGRPARNLSVTSLPRPSLRNTRPGMSRRSVRSSVLQAGIEVAQLEAGHLHVVDLAQVVVQAHHLQPLGFGRHHLPAGQVVQRRAPQHGLLATGVHRDVAADAAGFGRGGVDGEHMAGGLGGVGHALRHDAGFAGDGGHRVRHAGQADHLDPPQRLELLGVDDRAFPRQRHGAAGVAGAAATGNDRQAEFDAAFHQAGHLGFGVGREHDKGVLDAPVGGVRDVRDPRQAVELQVVLGGVPAQHLARRLAQIPHRAEMRGKGLDGLARFGQQLAHQSVALRVLVGAAALGHLTQPVVQRFDERLPPLGVVEQVVFQVGVALHHPDVAQHLVQHARRTAGAALTTQLQQQFPGTGAEQPDDDLAVGQRGVVVRNLAQPRVGAIVQQGAGRVQGGAGDRQRCVHRVNQDANAAAGALPGTVAGWLRRRAFPKGARAPSMTETGLS